MSKRKKPSSSSRPRSKRRRGHQAPPLVPGKVTRSSTFTLRSYEVGALPLIDYILDRMRLEELLRQYLPPDDPRCVLPTSRALLVLVRNVLISREPVYGVSEWAARYAPDLFNLQPHEISLLQDDRLGRCLTRLFLGGGPDLILAVVRQVIDEFQVSLQELHNDSTTVSFFGAYPDAAEEGTRQGRTTLAITWGHSKDHRPDLKQLLYILTVSHDGGVPVYFSTASGNVADDQTHRATWDLMCQLVGSPDFLYVADCKLASEENLDHIARSGGRFVTVMPRTHREDRQFRERLCESPDAVRWKPLYDVTDEDGNLLDQLSVCTDEFVSSADYRLLWFHSRRKVDQDQAARTRRTQRAYLALDQLRDRVRGPRTRFRDRDKVQQAIDEILEQYDVASFVQVRIEEHEEATYRQARPGRPNAKTPYQKETRHRFHFSWGMDPERLTEVERQDGVFPLLTNDRHLSPEEVLRAYKRQPLIEKRFSQFKNDFAVAPVYLKDVGRIQGLLAVYFFALIVQTLLERELRRAMAEKGLDALPLYPEGRPCARPTAHRVFEIFELVQRHVLNKPGQELPDVLLTEHTPLQRQILELLGLSAP